MRIDEMPDELILELYRITLLQLDIAKSQLKIIDKYGCMHEGDDPDFCKRNHTLSKKMALDTLAVFWNLRSGILSKNGYKKVTE